MKKVLAVTALVGAAGAATVAEAAPQPVALVSVTNYSNNGSGTFNLSLSTATWTFDSATGEAVITGGTYYGEVLSPNVFGHTMNGVTLGNFVPTLGTWSCQEGTFGNAVGASICGNYNFGSNKINQSTYTPSAQGASVAIGGDDASLGVPQSLQSSYSTMVTDTNGLAANQYRLSNAAFPGSTDSKSGYDFVFDLLLPPDAVDDLFSTIKNTSVVLPILANDTDWRSPVAVALFSVPAHGIALVTGSPGIAGPQSPIRITYTPAPGFKGTDSFQYVVDSGDAADVATVTMTVTGPVVTADTARTNAEVPITIDVLANDKGFSNPVSLGIAINPSHGSVVVNGSPGDQAGITVTYTPADGFAGSDTFDYTVDDGVDALTSSVVVLVAQDIDGDGVLDHQDNCRTIANPDQWDSNSDGYGNLCDADLDNSGFVNFTDLSLFRQSFGKADSDANLDGISIVNFTDLAIFKSLFGKPPGPSGSAP